MEVHVQLKTADGSVAGSLGYESAVSRALKADGLVLYPRYPGTQDSRQGTLFRVPVDDEETGARAIALLGSIEGVESAQLSYATMP